MVTVEYSLVGNVGTSEEPFNTVEEAIDWLSNAGRECFDNVAMADAYHGRVQGFGSIMAVYRENGDLYDGADDCLHLNAKSPAGGGVSCPDCGAWFCY
jgi:hypothetical protein